jgi:hypothetical protein
MEQAGGYYGQRHGKQAFQQSPGLQAADAAAYDFNQMTDLAERENLERDQIRGDLGNFITSTREGGQERIGEMLQSADTESAEMKEMAQQHKGEFEDFQKKNRADVKKYLDAGVAQAEQSLEQYETESLATVSAAAGGIQTSVESQIEQVKNQYANVPGGDQIAAQLTAARSGCRRGRRWPA